MNSTRKKDRLQAATRAWSKKIVGPAIVSTSLTAMAVTVGVVGVDAPSSVQAEGLSGNLSGALSAQDEAALSERGEETASRTARRVVLTPQATDRKWSTAPLNVWTEPREQGKKLDVLAAGSKLAVTGQVIGHWAEILVDGKARWVNADYLADEKPKPEVEESSSGAASSGACTNGTSVPSGVSPNVAAVHQAVCASFPEITTYGTFRDDGEHAQGLAIDIMVSGARGQEVADFVRANFSELGVSYVIYAQQIWSVDRASEGWRFMEDRGSVTANHYDHVHVTTY